MPFYGLQNLTQQSIEPCVPWEFSAPLPPEDVRANKLKRQEWHRNPATRWNYYSPIEPVNPRQRPSKDNPPKYLHAIVAEYDLQLPDMLLNEVIGKWRIKPAYVERSLGGNVRLVFLFPEPLLVESTDFASFLLQKTVEWLALAMLPGLDEGALADPMRFLANGAQWCETDHGPISADALNAFFVDAGREFSFRPNEGVVIPLDKVEKALIEKYPTYSWPEGFTEGTQGPSFWIPNSVSPKSAILKADGFFTFSAHADKVFYGWAELLGADFVKEINDKAISAATHDIWFDGKKYWRKKDGLYVGMELTELQIYLRVNCNLTNKGGLIDRALSHVHDFQYVENAAPYLFRPPGMLTYQGRRRLNTSACSVVKPSESTQKWGEQGNFPFISLLFDNIYTTDEQRHHFLAWYQYFYSSGLHQIPMPGPALFLMGGVNTGKTFTSREIVGKSVGGYVDAAQYLIGGEAFNAHVFEYGLWALDDDTIPDSPNAAQRTQNMLKKAVANTGFLSNKKFQQAGMVEWMGRIVATTNLDFISSRMLGPLDNSSFDKISVLRCQAESKIKFPSRSTLLHTVDTELPFFLRWLVDYSPPDFVVRDNRFGFQAFHEPSLMDQAVQTSNAAPFKEILIDALTEYFESNPKVTEWRGTASKLHQLLYFNPLRESVLRSLRITQFPRYLEAIEKDGSLKAQVLPGALNTRTWIFPRFTHE